MDDFCAASPPQATRWALEHLAVSSSWPAAMPSWLRKVDARRADLPARPCVHVETNSCERSAALATAYAKAIREEIPTTPGPARRVAAAATLNASWAPRLGAAGRGGRVMARRRARDSPEGSLGTRGAAARTRGTGRPGGRLTQDGPGCPVGRGLVASGGPPFVRRDGDCLGGQRRLRTAVSVDLLRATPNRTASGAVVPAGWQCRQPCRRCPGGRVPYRPGSGRPRRRVGPRSQLGGQDPDA
jgi:hypothetical protein